jgi:hypothetical protein
MSNRTQSRLRMALESVAEQNAIQQQAESEAAAEQQRLQTELQTVETPATDVVNLVNARHDAETARAHVDEVRSVQEGLTDVAELVETVNGNGGLTLESYVFLQHAVDNLTRRLGVDDLPMVPSLEAFESAEGGKVMIDLQNLQNLMATVEQGGQKLELRSIEVVVRMIEALSESLPLTCEKLAHVIEIANAREDEPAGNVVFGDGLNVALSVEGQIPEPFVNYMQRYSLLGQSMIERYSNCAFDAAMAVATLPDSLNFSSPEAFWASVEERVNAVEDPRQSLTEDQLGMVLPNGSALFGPKVDTEVPEGGNPILKKLLQFTDSRGVQEQINNPGEVERVEAGQRGYGRPALALNDIRVISRSLGELMEKVNLDSLAERGKAVRTDVISAMSVARTRYAEATPEMKMVLADHFNLVIKYIDAAYLLSDWPILNYLSNLVFTTNAFVLYAERSLALPDGGVPDEAPEEPEQTEPEVDPAATDTGVADPAAAAADPAAADPDAPAATDATPDPEARVNDPAADPTVDPNVAAAAAGEEVPPQATGDDANAAPEAGADGTGTDANTAAAADGDLTAGADENADAAGAASADAAEGAPAAGDTAATEDEEEEEQDQNAGTGTAA